MAKANIDEYIEDFPPATQKRLMQIRKIIRNILPTAQESISYAIPVYKVNNSNLVFFAGFKNHISIYPVPKGNETFLKEIAPYRTGKGTLQFPHDKPMPEKTIVKTVKLLLKEQQERLANKKKSARS